MGTLYLVPTPLGNLEDITLRALRILGEVDVIAAEDTRTTGRLLKHYALDRPLISYHEHSKRSGLERVLAALADGDVALVSDAGTPLVSDPGYKLGQAVLEQGHEIVALPGPSAVLTALSVSGLPSDSFAFFGFLPRKAAARRQLLASIKAYPATLIFFESPHRLQAALADLLAVLEAERPLAICRELTKLYEEVWRGTLAEANEVWPARSPRGEFTLVVGGAMGPALWDKNQVEETLVRLIAAGNSRKTAVQQIVLESGWSKKEVYTLAQQVGEE